MNKALFSSKTDNWATPDNLFKELNDKYNFTLDPCADDENHKCDMYFAKEDDGLSQDWGGHRVFCNPPYGRQIGKWMEKCYNESCKKETFVVALVPARTDTKWFHEYVLGKAEIIFIKGRLKFGGSAYNAPFPSMIIVWSDKNGIK